MAPRSGATGIVLAGGLSRRFGRDKASEPLQGHPLLQHVLDRLKAVVDDLLVVTAAGQALPPLAASVTRIEDLYPLAGPLGGLVTGLSALQRPMALAVACDTPLLQPSLLAELLRLAPGHDAVVPRAGGQAQPLCAAYAASALGPLRRRLLARELRLIDALASLDVLYLQPQQWQPFDPHGLSFRNLNREEDLREAERLLREEQGD